MGYMYAVIFVIAGLILIFKLSKENKIFYLAGAYFIVMGAWWGMDTFRPDWKVFSGVPGIVFKVITGIVLVVLGALFLKLNWESRKKQKEQEKKRAEARAKAALEAEIDAETAIEEEPEEEAETEEKGQ